MKYVRTSFNLTGRICRSFQPGLRTQLRQIYESEQNRRVSTGANKRTLPESPARTRFAPSPTGNLHLGSIRTALFNYLLARRTKGQFILRIEDTDQKRTIPGAEDRLFEDLRWAGLRWDEGPIVGGPYGPYKQSERTARYLEHVESLIKNRKAYRCFCSSERLDELNRSRHQKGLSLGYDRKCADIPISEAEGRAQKGEACVIRFRAPEQWPKYHDMVYGRTGHGLERTKKLLVEEPVYEDQILIKSDRFPTYHWANVCDDHDMQITHVVRGSEWMSSTPLHIALYQAFDWVPPLYAHVPLLVDANRQKLSKRNLDSDIASFRNTGIFSEALVNFAALLGWSHQRRSDVFSLTELEDIFDLKLTKGNTIISFDKLRFLQEQHARRMLSNGGEPLEQMIRDVAVAVLEKYGASQVLSFLTTRKLRDVIASMLQAESLPYRSPKDFANQISIFLMPAQQKPPFEISGPCTLQSLRVAAASLCLTPAQNWTKDILRSNLMDINISQSSDEELPAVKKLWKKDLYHYLRWALLGGIPGPSIPDTMEILGRETCIYRLQDAATVSKELETMATKPDVLNSVSTFN